MGQQWDRCSWVFLRKKKRIPQVKTKTNGHDI
jgi:hypothetical protein